MDVLMPQLGETVTEGTVSQWFKSVGDKVAAGEALFEIETDKTSMEVEATTGGVLAEIRVEAGEAVPVGTAVAVITTGDAPPPKQETAEPAAKPALAAAPVAAAPPRRAAVPARPAGGAPSGFGPFSEVFTPEENYGKAEAPRGLRITPLARRLAARSGVDLAALAARVEARGARRIAKADVLAFSGGGAAPATAERIPAPSSADADVVPLNRIRRATGEHLARAWVQVPHVFQAVEVEFTVVDRVRRALNDENADGWGFRLSYLPFIARAVCLAIRAYPQVNASVDGDRLLVHRRVHLGIAVDLGLDGLVVPVIRGAEDYNVVGLARAINDAANRARSGRLSQDDLAGGTYTISNSGTFGTLFTAPIVNAPQVAILSTDGVRKRPVVVEDEIDGDRIAIRPVGIVAQSFDHRAFDGAYSAAFLNEVRTILETRDWQADSG